MYGNLTTLPNRTGIQKYSNPLTSLPYVADLENITIFRPLSDMQEFITEVNHFSHFKINISLNTPTKRSNAQHLVEY